MSNEEESKTELSLTAEETAIVLIEFQNEFTTEGGALHDAVKDCMEKTGTLENARKAMDAARSAGCKIFHLPITFEEVSSRNTHLCPVYPVISFRHLTFTVIHIP